VFNRAGEQLGTVYNFMVDKVTGQVAYVVMSFGGFIGLGESYHPLPWRALTYAAHLIRDENLGTFVLGITPLLAFAKAWANGSRLLEHDRREPASRHNVTTTFPIARPLSARACAAVISLSEYRAAIVGRSSPLARARLMSDRARSRAGLGRR
jgi:PRC-barrel domain